MKKIILDESCKNSFLDYATERVAKQWNAVKVSRYFTYENAEKLYHYFASGSTYCDNKGGFYLHGKKTCFIATSIYFTSDNQLYKAGTNITSPKLILEYENYCFENDYILYREDNLFHNVWCEIERILRVNYEGWDVESDIKLFKKYCK